MKQMVEKYKFYFLANLIISNKPLKPEHTQINVVVILFCRLEVRVKGQSWVEQWKRDL